MSTASIAAAPSFALPAARRPRSRRPDARPRAARSAAHDERRTAPKAAEPRILDGAALSLHLDRLYRAALALSGSRTNAEDLVQEVCVRALSKPRVIRGADDLPYLLQMLRNVFYNQWRTQATRRTTPVEPDALTTIPSGRRGDPEFGTLVRDVHRAIAALPEPFRDVVVAVDVMGLPYADAAEALEVPVGTVMSRLHRGRNAVARSMGDVLATG
jgi:RNA polymerase sigma-70 factor, ECF subfamily